MVLHNTCLIVHENIAVIGYYYTTWWTLEESDVGDQVLAAATDLWLILVEQRSAHMEDSICSILSFGARLSMS